MKKKVIDVHDLPTTVFGHRDPVWWSVMLAIAIEGTILVLLAISYFYVRDRTVPFPPDVASRSVGYVGAIELFLWIASLVPTKLASDASKRHDIRGVRINLIIATALGLAALVLRCIELDMLPFRWDANAYGSVVWALLVGQLTHQITGVIENGFFIGIYVKGPVEEKHLSDINVTTPLWYFVVAGAALVFALVHGDILLVVHR